MSSYTGQGYEGTCTAALSATTRLLTFVPSSRVPQVYRVNVMAYAALDGVSLPRSTLGQFLRCTLTAGPVSKTFEVDLGAGGALFDVTCDSLTVDVVNGDADAADVLMCSGSVTRYAEGATSRPPRRTVVVPVNAGSQQVSVPRHSVAFETVTRNGAITYNFWDADGAAVVGAQLPAATQNGARVALPLSCERLDLNPVTIAFAMVFEIGV